jgi:hypothetical protein
MSKVRKLSDVAQLEQQYLTLLAKTRTLIDALKPVRSKFRNLKADIQRHNHIYADWVENFTSTAEAAWEACRAVYAELPETDPPPITDAVVEVIRAARNVVQADHACLYGHPGCEQRWDKAMVELKRAMSQVSDQ